ncbi:LacI family DNA-binding transcriptional regulator [Motilibacter rhizosphaerae]|uniref:LacI family DNA-binding transcriptional regulator n=1 Tax=Motilibacter rhizosphaerae TaxID=598652 RepID=UPI001E43F135|nr:LacI family DNA-binding transcriptional regulator [Motilibacter rhizosphaerae]
MDSPRTASSDAIASATQARTGIPVQERTADESGPSAPSPALSRATVTDVARLAGVSGKTVSRVFAGSSSVSPETRTRVLEAAQRLRFRPNSLARDLRRGGVSTTVAFVMGDLSNAFYSKVAAGIERELAEHGLTLVIAATDDEAAHEQRVVGAMLERRVRSLLLVPIAPDQGYLEGERQLGTPVICVDRPARNLVTDSVVFDNAAGAEAAVRSLVQHGHRRVAFVGSAPTLYTHEERLAGYRRALAAAGIAPRPEYERHDATDATEAERATRALLALPEPPTALLAGNNKASVGILAVRQGMLQPFAFVGFDDFDLAATLGVSVVAHDPGEMGRAAVRLALWRQDDLVSPPRQVVVPTWLVQRGSGELAP